MQGYLYCTSNRDREGEFAVGFTVAHVSSVLLQLDENGHAKPIRLEFAKATPYGADALDAILRLLSRYARRISAPPNVYVFANISYEQIYEFFGAVYGDWFEVDIPMGSSVETDAESITEELTDDSDGVVSEISYQSESSELLPKKKVKPSMDKTFYDGQIVRHHIKERLDADNNIRIRESILEAVYCKNTKRLVCATDPKVKSVSGLAKVNCKLAGRSESINGWENCKYKDSNGDWKCVKEIINRFGLP